MRYTLDRFSTTPAEATPARAHYTGQALSLFASIGKIPAGLERNLRPSAETLEYG
jgi:hypothetical protein